MKTNKNMKTNFYKAALLAVFAVVIMSSATICRAQRVSGGRGSLKTVAQDKPETFSGTLEMGKTDSAIVYVGKESGDVAAFCFKNDSEVGRAILAACKKGEQCEFTGQIDMEAGCKIKDERTLSASGRITSIKSVKRKTKRPVKGDFTGKSKTAGR